MHHAVDLAFCYRYEDKNSRFGLQVRRPVKRIIMTKLQGEWIGVNKKAHCDL